MSEQEKRKISLNQLPDAEKLSRIVERAEENQKARSTDLSSEMRGEHPGGLMPPADWPVERKLLHGKVVAALKTVYDPEIPVDIYELGLIYKIDISPENKVHVRMTLTAPGCPVADTLPQEVEAKIEAISEVPEATVEVVWDPPWSKDRMSEAARLALGFF